MYQTRWAIDDEIPIMADYWYRMACEMGETDGIPITEGWGNVLRYMFLQSNGAYPKD